MMGYRNRGGHEDDCCWWNKEPADEQEHVDHSHEKPAIDLHVGNGLGKPLREVERSQHVAEQHGGGNDRQDHHRLSCRVAQDGPPPVRGPHAVDQHREQHAYRGAHSRRK